MEKRKNLFIVVLLIIIILFQVGVKLYVANEKSYIHIDEGYSYGLMNYDKIEFSENEDFYNNWHSDKYYLDYLSVNSDEVWDLSAVYQNQKNDVHPPLFYLLLRVAASFTIDEFTKWTGILLNVIIFICSMVTLFLLSKQIFKNPIYALIVCFASGFSIASIESTIFVRMYELATLLLLVISYLHIKNYDKQVIDIKSLILIGIFAVLGSLTHYYNIIFLGVLYLIFMTRYIVKKNWKNAIRYTITMLISAICSLAIFPYSIAHMFFGYRGQGIIESFSDLYSLLVNFAKYIYIVHTQVFNFTLIVLVAIIAICAITIFVKNGKLSVSVRNRKLLLVALPAFVYFALVAAASPYQEIRYILPISPIIILVVIYIIKVFFERILPQKVSIILCGILVVLISILPLKLDFKMSYSYSNLKDFVQEVETDYKELPTLYVFETEHNRFMDDIYIFSIIKESYIMNSYNFSNDNLAKVFNGKNLTNGIMVFINEGQNNNKILDEIVKTLGFSNATWFERLNACDVYIIK